MNDLAGLRREYAEGGLDEVDLESEPVSMFRRWLDEALASPMHEPNAMVLATVSAGGRPSSRTVLLKGLDERGFVFYTNYRSRKAAELADNPACALLFPWHPVGRQVRIEGDATQLTVPENAAYFGSRPRESQVGAWASPQSELVPDRAFLDRRYADVADQFADRDVPLPPHWGGYRVAPRSVELWQGRPGRMHDRLRYRWHGDGWVVDRLAP